MGLSVVCLGAGEHAKVLLEIVRYQTDHRVVGLLDADAQLKDKRVLDYPVLGDDRQLSSLFNEGIQFFMMGLGSVVDNKPRKNLYDFACSIGMKALNIIDKSAVIAPSVYLQPGVVILRGVLVNSSVRLGENVIINTGAIVEHDCDIGHHVHIASGAILGGGVTVGEGAFIGAGAVIRDHVSIGAKAVVGAGAVVVKDVMPHQTVVGNPAGSRLHDEV